jgi:CheY-like chemotaxis protein
MKKILLIEDNKDMRENTTEILELANFKVTAAKNGKEGVEHALKEKAGLDYLRHHDARAGWLRSAAHAFKERGNGRHSVYIPDSKSRTNRFPQGNGNGCG